MKRKDKEDVEINVYMGIVLHILLGGLIYVFIDHELKISLGILVTLSIAWFVFWLIEVKYLLLDRPILDLKDELRDTVRRGEHATSISRWNSEMCRLSSEVKDVCMEQSALFETISTMQDKTNAVNEYYGIKVTQKPKGYKVEEV